jgi:hypothetical protein
MPAKSIFKKLQGADFFLFLFPSEEGNFHGNNYWQLLPMLPMWTLLPMLPSQELLPMLTSWQLLPVLPSQKLLPMLTS